MTKLPGPLATPLSLLLLLVTTLKRINKWNSSRTWTLAGLILLLASMAGTVRAQLVTNVTIYQDNFARTGALDGSMPDTVNAPGASWIACNNPGLNAQIQTDGSEIALTNVPGTTNGVYLNGFLPFTPQVGHIYTLSCKIQVLSGGNQWLAMGFAVNPLTNNFFAAISCGAGWNLIRGNGTGVQPYRFPGGSGNPAQKTAAFGTTTNLFSVVLDTTTGTGAARGWTYRFFTNGVQVDAYATGNDNPTMIKYVGIGADAAQGNFQQFTLTDVLMRQGTPTIVEEPQDRTAPVGQTATFWVGVTNDYPTAWYQWMTNSPGGPTNAIPGATNATYTTPVLDMSYNGLNYSVSITNALGSTNSGSAVLNVVSTPPVVYSVTKTVAPTNIVVTFSKAVDPVTGLNPANYALLVNTKPSGISIIGASAGSVPGSVILQTSVMDTNQSYYLTVQNVQDLYGNAMTISTNGLLPYGMVLFLRGDSGVVLDANNNVVQWLDQTTNGNNASQFFGVPSVGLVGSASRPGLNVINNGQPSLDFGNLGSGVALLHFLQAPSSPSLASMMSNSTMYAVAEFYSTAGNDLVNKTWGNLPAPFDWDPSAGENVQYGNGFNNAPAGGAGATISINVPYVLASKIQYPTAPGAGLTNFNFYLNGANNGAGSIRGVTGTPSGAADGGTPLWIGGRPDLQAANPKMRGQIAEIMLFNNALSDNDRLIVDNYLGAKYFQFAIIQDLPATTTSSNGFSVTYTFIAGQGSGHGFSYQWQENGTNVPGATGQTFTTGILGPGDNGDTFDVVLTLPDGSTTNSVVNTLTVLSEPPYVTSAGFPIWEATSPSHIVLTFDEAVDPATATVAGNYILNSGSVISAAIGAKPNKVVLTTTPLSAWNANPGNYSLMVQNVQDMFGNTIVTASIPVGLYPAGTSLWLEGNTGVGIDPGGNPVFPGSAAVNQWSDQSGNGANLYQVFGTSLEPLVVTNYHGNTAIQFSGTNVGVNYNGKASGTFLSSVQLVGGNDYPCLRITGDLSIIAVATFNASVGTSGEIVGKTGSTSANQPAPYDYFSGTGVQLLRGDGTNNTSFTSTNTPSIGFPHIVGVTQSGLAITHFLDDATTGIGSANTLSPYVDQGTPLSIGERNDNVNRLNGQMLELILISSALDSNDVASLDNYLASKYTIPTGTNAYPAITQQPVALTNVSQNVTLTVPVGLLGNPLAIQWYDTNSIAISGQTNSTLSIPNIQTSDAYFLVATNIYGSVTSSKVVVNVSSSINNNPTNITFSVANNQLTLTWPADHTGWHLQSNSVGLTAADSWFSIPGSAATNQFIVTPDATMSNVFYRMVYP